MKTAINNNGISVQVADNVTVKTINGVHYLLTADEEAQQAASQQAWEAGEVRRNAIAEIKRLESLITERRKREASLGTDNGWLASQEVLIQIERDKL